MRRLSPDYLDPRHVPRRSLTVAIAMILNYAWLMAQLSNDPAFGIWLVNTRGDRFGEVWAAD